MTRSTQIRQLIPKEIASDSINEAIIVTAICCLSYIVLTILAWFVVGNNPVDFIVQVGAAVDIANGKVLYRDIGERVIGGARLPRPLYPPLHLYSLGFVYWILGIKQLDEMAILTAKSFLVTFLVADSVLIYLIVRKELNNRLAALAMLGFTYHPAIIGSLVGFHEVFLIFFLLLATIFFQREKITLSGVFTGFGLLAKQITVVHAWVILISIVIVTAGERPLTRARQALSFIVSSAVVVFIGFLPFLFLASPQQVLEDVLVSHLTRNDPNMSLYYYYGRILDQTRVLFILQATAMILLPLFIKAYLSDDLREKRGVICSIVQLVFLTAFYMLNRIFYPHYLPQFIPWLCITIVFWWHDYSTTTTSKNARFVTLLALILLSHVVMVVAAGAWGLTWLLDATPTTMNDHPLYVISAAMAFLALAAFLFSQIFILLERDKMSREGPVALPRV